MLFRVHQGGAPVKTSMQPTKDNDGETETSVLQPLAGDVQEIRGLTTTRPCFDEYPTLPIRETTLA